MDGGDVGELEFENFNAASAKITIKGVSVHPGYAKGKMVNANALAAEFAKMLPEDETPETTEGYQGFYHLLGITSNIEQAKLSYIIRDHDREKFEEKKALITAVADFLNKKYGDVVKLELKHQYYNMRQEVEPHFFIVERAIKAMEMANIKPKVQPIRGGTDGANLSFMGLPCPNIFAGGHNFHGKLEYVPLESMMKASEVILNIITLFQAEG
jgi:tripeptide aminopeptidase